MAVKTQVVLDDETRSLLEELARPRGGNRSFVVREALKTYAAMENELDALERIPAFRQMMESSNADIDHGRLHPHDDAKKIVGSKTK